ncbi:MAG: hypothetical protein PHZ09_03720, partial [Eubacteriales bacterium]|nr:hypothetical protein [Eubacteriales bacterium]
TEETAAPELKPDLPDLDLEGRNFRYLVKMEGTESGRWTALDIYVEEETGEAVNDSVYRRNRLVEDRFNTNIVQTLMNMGGQYSYSMHAAISKLAYAGDDSYDAVMPTIQDCAYLARDGILYDLNALEYIDLGMPWWNERFYEDTVIKNRAFYANGSISETFMRAVYCLLFNKQLITDYSIDNPYDAVMSGSWTIEKLMEMSSVFAGDINGDGVLDDSDNTGLIVLNNQIEALYTASGQKLVTVDKEGMFTFTGNSPSSFEVLEKIYNLYEARDVVLCATDTRRRAPETGGLGHVEAAAAAFEAGRNLFLLGTMNNVPGMRNMETDFGILPLPMASGGQDDYYSYVQTWAGSAVAVMITAKDAEASSVVIEEMAYRAMEIMTPAYYEITLKTKYARDEESQTMLDIIYRGRSCDLGNLFNIGSLVSGITSMIYEKRENNFASLMAGKEEAISKTLADITALYGEASG